MNHPLRVALPRVSATRLAEGGRAREFHISRFCREKYHFDEALFTQSGNVVFADFHAVRTFVARVNRTRDLIAQPETALHAGAVNAMGLIDEILHVVFQLYGEEVDRTIGEQALRFLEERVGREALGQVLTRFASEFPPLAVTRGELTAAEYATDEERRRLLLEELVMLWLANQNPAFTPYLELFDDEALTAETAYPRLFPLLTEFFTARPPFGPDEQPLLEMLRSPAIAVPHSLPGQLQYIREHWGLILKRFHLRLLGGLDLIREEERPAFTGPGEPQVIRFAGSRGEGESERFSPDSDWMPNLVMIAKSIYVWLDQLGKAYGRPVTTLRDIPDEELDRLARQGFSGLWLIGIWERSRASKEIKRRCGNPEAEASAYSLAEYRVADELGGDEAYEQLKERLGHRGIRLATDMVPNHMGLDSPWVTRHPDRFLQLGQAPFPAYSFQGDNLSSDPGIEIRIEDHYYDRTDAAVVFQWRDRGSGRVRYIYHGNDGTRMPWNDTAQLDYLNGEVREAVIRQILEVARRSPIIRFDAAMTLAKKHYQRLWFPEPGSGGDIPSRAGQGMSKAEFDRLMPTEFFREVVDRIAREAPGTLLLAEAFWLMEGYFVRTLGMHRVYNSAFMNFLKGEQNDRFRQSVKNVLDFQPEILRRYVNFLNNPDEETAVAQFGKGDKYFGICLMMVTMPGLPMFGHGQIEGYAEKYGMEYRRAYWDERADDHLIARHEHEIFPLLRRRALFSGVDHFQLYDFTTPGGQVDENVFAYSNRHGDERALVVVHNRYAETSGRVHIAAGKIERSGPGGEPRQVRRSLGEALGLRGGDHDFLIFRETISGLEYIRRAGEVASQGLSFSLRAYDRRVLLDWREMEDPSGTLAAVESFLAGRGTPSIAEAERELSQEPVRQAAGELLNRGFLDWLATDTLRGGSADPERVNQFGERMARLLEALAAHTGQAARVEPLVRRLQEELKSFLTRPPRPDKLLAVAQFGVAAPVLDRSLALLAPGENGAIVFLFWLCVHRLGQAFQETDFASRSRSLIDEYRFDRLAAPALVALGIPAEHISRIDLLVKVITGQQDGFQELVDQAVRQPSGLTRMIAHRIAGQLADGDVQTLLGVNRHRDILWFSREGFETLTDWMLVFAVMRLVEPGWLMGAGTREVMAAMGRARERLVALAEESGYRFEEFSRLLATFE